MTQCPTLTSSTRPRGSSAWRVEVRSSGSRASHLVMPSRKPAIGSTCQVGVSSTGGPNQPFATQESPFQPTPKIREIVKGEKDGFMVTGGITRDWRLQRTKARIVIVDALPFLDVEDPATHAHLSEVLSGQLVALGYESEDLDFSDICNRDRRLSRAIAEYA